MSAGVVMDFQQSQTYQNLLNAYGGELESSTRYRLYADRARQDGYQEIGVIMDTASRNDMEHARIWLRRLNNGILPDTEANLQTAANDEATIGNTTYREYARVAREEGYNDIAALFNGVANIELNHNLTFQTLHDELVRGEIFCKSEQVLWICMECGNIMSSLCAPEICPVCGFPQAYYRLYTGSRS
jgi:rubrerythrin